VMLIACAYFVIAHLGITVRQCDGAYLVLGCEMMVDAVTGASIQALCDARDRA
jgi:hypothetical protein